MRLPFISRRREYLVERLLRDDAPVVAKLHREDFARPWSAGEFADLIDQATVFGFIVREVGRRADPAGFVLARNGNAAQMAALAASLAFTVQAVLLGAMLIREGIWRPSVAALRPIAAALLASGIMLATLAWLEHGLNGWIGPDQPTLHRIMALAVLCGGGLASYGAAGWLMGAFGALRPPRPLRKRQG